MENLYLHQQFGIQSGYPQGEPLLAEPIKSICQVCKASFGNIRGLRQHEGKIHSVNLGTFECSQCLKLLKTKSALTAHKKNVHEKSAKFTCQKCGKILHSKCTYKLHIKKTHPPILTIG